jgi:hypothetical protein
MAPSRIRNHRHSNPAASSASSPMTSATAVNAGSGPGSSDMFTYNSGIASSSQFTRPSHRLHT